MIVLGLDPGSAESALVAWDPIERRVRFRCKRFNGELADVLLERHAAAPDSVLVIERTKGYTMPLGKGDDARRFFPQQVLDTAEWSGYFRRVGEELGLRVEALDRRAVKLNLLGRASGTDAQVREALVDLIGPKGTKAAPGPTFGMSADLWAALAVAYVWHELARGTLAAAPRSTIESGRESPARAGDDRPF